jgi:hypothetical protein
MVRKLFLCILVAALAIVPAFAAKKEKKSKTAKVDVTQVALAKATPARAVVASHGGGNLLAPRDPFAGLTEEERAAVLDMALKSDLVKNNLKESRYRVLGVEATAVKIPNGLRREAHTMIIDVGKNKTYHVVNDVTAGAPGNIIQATMLDSFAPFMMEEYAEARELMMKVDRVQKLMEQPNMGIQNGFPPQQSPVAACADYSHRCVEMHVVEAPPGKNGFFRLLVTVDLSAGQVVEVREPKTPTALAR